MAAPEGQVLFPGEGRLIQGGGLHATLKIPGGPFAAASTFEIRVPPGYDVGAHVHGHAEELFFVLAGELTVMAFEPVSRHVADWRHWVSPNGATPVTVPAGSVMHVPAGCPHVFANLGPEWVTMLFQSCPGGHERYFEELAALLRASSGRPDEQAVIELRTRHDIEQITTLHAPPPVLG